MSPIDADKTNKSTTQRHCSPLYSYNIIISEQPSLWPGRCLAVVQLPAIQRRPVPEHGHPPVVEAVQVVAHEEEAERQGGHQRTAYDRDRHFRRTELLRVYQPSTPANGSAKPHGRVLLKVLSKLKEMHILYNGNAYIPYWTNILLIAFFYRFRQILDEV